MREEIKSHLDALVGSKLQYAGRASNLFWTGFGEMIMVTRRGQTKESAEYTLHIQCSWRITHHDKILVASNDYYYPSTEHEVNENFDWDVIGNNRFDERIKAFARQIRGSHLIVESVDSDKVGGLKISLSNSYILEVFPDSSQDDENSEFWRFFTYSDESSHFVVTGNGIEMQ